MVPGYLFGGPQSASRRLLDLFGWDLFGPLKWWMFSFREEELVRVLHCQASQVLPFAEMNMLFNFILVVLQGIYYLSLLGIVPCNILWVIQPLHFDSGIPGNYPHLRNPGTMIPL